MSVSDWLLLAVVVSAFVAPIVFERWKHKFYGPELDFEFGFRPPHCHLTEIKASQKIDGKVQKVTRFPAYYFRFSLVNRGKSSAENCEAVLEKVWEQDPAGKLEEWDFVPVNLKWSGSGPKTYFLKTIQPRRNNVFCDIGRIQHPQYEAESVYALITEEDKRKNKFFFEAPSRPFSQWDCLVPGKYQIQVSVYSRNAKPIHRTFRISWSGEWKPTEEEMFEQVVMS